MSWWGRCSRGGCSFSSQYVFMFNLRTPRFSQILVTGSDVTLCLFSRPKRFIPRHGLAVDSGMVSLGAEPSSLGTGTSPK